MAVEVRDDLGLVLQLAFPASKGNVMNNHVPIRSVDAVSTGGRPNLLDKASHAQRQGGIAGSGSTTRFSAAAAARR